MYSLFLTRDERQDEEMGNNASPDNHHAAGSSCSCSSSLHPPCLRQAHRRGSGLSAPVRVERCQRSVLPCTSLQTLASPQPSRLAHHRRSKSRQVLLRFPPARHHRAGGEDRGRGEEGAAAGAGWSSVPSSSPSPRAHRPHARLLRGRQLLKGGGDVREFVRGHADRKTRTSKSCARKPRACPSSPHRLLVLEPRRVCSSRERSAGG
mmetsp:Transcript_6013/g.21228  ORF Transcript_6013/g.21228 Transcript_6013/m.21228 type:complete len:207 (-) Transcript_6013:316-936(-)